ncbi:MAG: hypothetical protein KAH67_07035 [Flavobacteriaceae bacterium]|nr:hypothetical protein [Flavobacteriaceae bacterium]
MTEHKNKDVFQNKESKSLFNKGIKYLAIALPLLFISPILITIGFKAINKSNNYIVVIIGCILAIFTIVMVTQAFRLILKSLFNK